MKINQIQTGLLFLFSVFFSVLVFNKAYIAGFTHDESLTFNQYVGMSITEIVTMTSPSANNHILNTLLMKASSALFSNKEWALRLPNSLSFLVFCFFSIRIFLSSKRNWSSFLFFILLFFQPFLIDMFATGRGYGISYALISGGLFYLMRYAKDQKPIDQLSSLVFIFLATLASLNLIYLLVSIIFYINVLGFISKHTFQSYFRSFFYLNRFTLLISIVSIISLYQPFVQLIAYGQLYFGGEIGFWKNTISSIIDLMIYNHYYFSNIQLVLAGVFLLGCVLILYSLFTRLQKVGIAKLVQDPTFILSLILLLIALASITNHLLFGTLFMIRRTAFFLFIIFIYALTTSISQTRTKPYYNYSTRSFSLILIFISVFQFANSYSNISFLEWERDADVKRMLFDLKKETMKNQLTAPVLLGITWIYEPSINYYRNTYGFNEWLEPVDRNGINKHQDVYYLTEEDEEMAASFSTRIITRYEDTRTVLIRGKNN